METGFDLCKETASGPKKSRFSCKLIPVKNGAGGRREWAPRSSRTSPPFCFASKPATVPPKARCLDLRCNGSRKSNCLFFEGSKFRRPCHEVLSEHYPLEIKGFCIAEVVGTVGAKARSCMVTAFNPTSRNRDSMLRAKADGPNTQTEHSSYARDRHRSMSTQIYSCHHKALGAPTFAAAVAAPRSCLRPCLTLCAPSASSTTGGQSLESNQRPSLMAVS